MNDVLALVVPRSGVHANIYFGFDRAGYSVATTQAAIEAIVNREIVHDPNTDP